MSNTKIYLDHAATSPMPNAVIEVMTNTMRETYGNASTSYDAGRKARRILEDARQTIADSLGADRSEITYTSGGTESDNQALIAAMEEDERRNGRKGTLITSAIEHHAILHTCDYLEARGYNVLTIPVNDTGTVDPDALETTLAAHPDTALVSIMAANNEIGTIEPIAALGEIAHAHGALFHTDAVQAYGKIPLDLRALPVDLLSISAHKLGGPKGIGALYIRGGVRIGALLHGGYQERGRRAGTENVPAAAGFARAVELAMAGLDAEAERERVLQVLFCERMTETFGAAGERWMLNGPAIGGERLPNNISISLPGQDMETLLINLDLAGIAASGGSACTTGALDPSHVIMAISDNDAARARGTLRFTLGPGNTAADVEAVVAVLADVVK